MSREFKCPKCGGRYFGAVIPDKAAMTELQADPGNDELFYRLVVYYCHSTSDGRYSLSEWSMFSRPIWSKDQIWKPCGWKGKAPQCLS